MFAKVLLLAAVATATNVTLTTFVGGPNTAETCATDFVEKCLGTADANSCNACVKAFPQGDCSGVEGLLFDGVCQKAPFNAPLETCITEVVTDCAAAFTNEQQCAECILLHTKDLKAHNCSTADIAGVAALCTQIKPPVPTPVPPPPSPTPPPAPTPPTPAGKAHYGDPAQGCLSDEEKVQVTGLAGDFCAPDCTTAACPTDVPAGVTATGQCLLKASTGDSKKCCLVCSPSAVIKDQKAADAQCGTNASCKAIQTTGICTYDDAL